MPTRPTRSDRSPRSLRARGHERSAKIAPHERRIRRCAGPRKARPVRLADAADEVSLDSEIDYDDEQEEDQIPLDIVEAIEAGVLLDDPGSSKPKATRSADPLGPQVPLAPE